VDLYLGRGGWIKEEAMRPIGAVDLAGQVFGGNTRKKKKARIVPYPGKRGNPMRESTGGYHRSEEKNKEPRGID